jgi:hypothetical protein
MSQGTVLEKSTEFFASASMPRTRADKALETSERAIHYLHLSAAVCEKCHGPVLSGWIGQRENDIAQETQINTVGAICLCCGLRPKVPVDPEMVTHIRPFRWDWIAAAPLSQTEPERDGLSVELSQDADNVANLSQAKKAGLL